MAGVKYKVFRAALNTLYFSGAYRALRPLLGGVGAILMLHHVRPSRRDRFQPNHLLEVTPRFFETVIRRLRRSKVDLISLDEMHRRLTTVIIRAAASSASPSTTATATTCNSPIRC